MSRPKAAFYIYGEVIVAMEKTVRTLTMLRAESLVPAMETMFPARQNAVRVRVRRGEAWHDITDYVLGGSVRHDNDNPVGQLTLTLASGHEHDSIVPGDENSPLNIVNGVYEPLLDRYNEIIVDAAMSTDGTTPEAWLTMFGGYLGDTIATDDDPDEGITVRVEARDYAKQLQDDYIIGTHEYENMYASQIIQALLTDRFNAGHLPQDIQLRVIGDDDFWHDKVELGNSSTWDAIQSFAEQSDKDIRYMLDESTGDIRLTYWTPSRSMVPAWQIDASNIMRESLNTSDAGNRYKVTVRWRDGDGEVRETVKEDQTHRKPDEPLREMLIEEEYTNLINDSDAAERFAEAVLDATKNTPATDEIRLPFSPYMRLHDVVEVTSESVRTGSHMYAVEAIEYHFSADEWWTEMTASSSVKLRPLYWLSLDARRGVGAQMPPESIGGGGVALPAPEGVAVSEATEALIVEVPAPPVHSSRWDVTEVQVSTDSEFGVAETLTARDKGTRFTFDGLDGGGEYHVRAAYIDINGRKWGYSNVASGTPKRIQDALPSDLFGVEITSDPAPDAGDLESLLDNDPATGVEFSGPATITIKYPVVQGSDVADIHLSDDVLGYIQVRDIDTDAWIDVYGSEANPMQFHEGWNRPRFDGDKLYYGREYRFVAVGAMGINVLRYERTVVADLVVAGTLKLREGMKIVGGEGGWRGDQHGITIQEGDEDIIAIGDVSGRVYGTTLLPDGKKGLWGARGTGLFLQGYSSILRAGTADDEEILTVPEGAVNPKIIVTPLSVASFVPVTGSPVLVQTIDHVYDDTAGMFRVLSKLSTPPDETTFSGTTWQDIPEAPGGITQTFPSSSGYEHADDKILATVSIGLRTGWVSDSNSWAEITFEVRKQGEAWTTQKTWHKTGSDIPHTEVEVPFEYSTGGDQGPWQLRITAQASIIEDLTYVHARLHNVRFVRGVNYYDISGNPLPSRDSPSGMRVSYMIVDQG